MYVLMTKKSDGSKHVHCGCVCSIDDKGVIDITKEEEWVASYNPDFYNAENMEGEAAI